MTAPRTWSTPAMLRSRLVRAYQRIGRLRAIKREVFDALAKARHDLDEELDRVRRRDIALQVQVDHAWLQTKKANTLEDELKKVRQTAVDELNAMQALIDAMDPDNMFDGRSIKECYTPEDRERIAAAREALDKVKARTC